MPYERMAAYHRSSSKPASPLPLRVFGANRSFNPAPLIVCHRSITAEASARRQHLNWPVVAPKPAFPLPAPGPLRPYQVTGRCKSGEAVIAAPPESRLLGGDAV